MSLQYIDEVKELKKIIGKHGIEHQIGKCYEEFAELMVELSHWKENRADTENIQKEIADCMIMLNQMALYFGAEKVKGFYSEALRNLKNK